jgi:phosphate-selective porin O/P
MKKTVCVALVLTGLLASTVSAQVTPAAAHTPPDDTPSIRVGAVLFPDYTYTINPKTTDTDGNSINLSQFNITRAYINVTGNISHIVAFRVTPDISRETSSFSALTGSLEFRIKYAYAQFNFDEWMGPGSYARFGVQQTPWLDFAEGIYRYRFPGTMFAEREGYFASADGGASFHYQLPSNYGDFHVGIFNGENYNKAEANNEKAVMFRGTVRPFASPETQPILRGLRASFFYDADNYVKNGPRNRLIAALHFEHAYLNAGYEFLDTADRTSITRPEVDGRGYSIWATPKTPKGFEGLVRFDHITPSTATGSQTRNRTIVGAAYWFPHQGGVTSALLVDYDGQTFKNFLPAQAKQSKVAVHGLISF